MLNLSDITSKIRIITIFAIFYSYIIFHTRFVDMVVICLHTKFHMPSSNGSLVIATKPKTKYTFHAEVTLFYTHKNTLTKVAYFSNILPYIILVI
jgi:hypothetical protein